MFSNRTRFVLVTMMTVALTAAACGAGADSSSGGAQEPALRVRSAPPAAVPMPDLWKELAWVERYERFDQMVADAALIVRGTVTSVGPGRVLSTETYRSFRVEVRRQYSGEPADEILFEDGSANLRDGTSVGVSSSPWLAPGDEVLLFLRVNDAISDGDRPAFEVQHAFSVVRVGDDMRLENPPRFGAQVVAEELGGLDRAVLAALDEISALGYVPLPSRDEWAVLAATRTSDPVVVAVATATSGDEAELVVAGTATGFCWAIVTPGSAPGATDWACPSFDLVNALAADRPYLAPAGPGDRWLVGLGPASDPPDAPELETIALDAAALGFEIPTEVVDRQIYFGPNPEDQEQ